METKINFKERKFKIEDFYVDLAEGVMIMITAIIKDDSLIPYEFQYEVVAVNDEANHPIGFKASFIRGSLRYSEVHKLLPTTSTMQMLQTLYGFEIGHLIGPKSA